MSKLIDLTGQTFGYWKVLQRGENTKNGQAMWLCKCTKCNETVKLVRGRHLRSGRSKACTSCRQKSMVKATTKDETGKIYGYLKVNRKATEEEKPRQDRTGVYWNCTCLNCGNENVIVFGDYLRNGDTKSCGCLISIHESQIKNILDKEKIRYIPQFSFDNLISPKNNKTKLKFDFAVVDENNTVLYLIEYDGIQHFEKGHFHDTFYRTHESDLVKNNYCFKNQIPLIRIPYTHKKITIEDLKTEITSFLLTEQNEDNYYSLPKTMFRD